MGRQAAIVGASGYAGGELLRLLLGHPDIEVATIAAASNAGRPVADMLPNLPGLADRVFDDIDPRRLAEADIVFLALPHGESAQVANDLPESVLVVDLGADFRLQDAESWQRYYGQQHAGAWTYGLPELAGQRAVIAGSTRISNPGCYPTAVALALAPLLDAGLVEASDIAVVAASGTSGAGRSAKPSLLGSEVMGDVSAYKVGGTHQHTPEMVQSLSAAAGRPVTLSFTPLLAPMPRGILATCTARLADGAATSDQLRSAMLAAYDGEPFVHLLAEGSWPRTAATAGSNTCHLQVTADPSVGRAIVIAAIDNLGKGAAGQAVQNANLALGLPEGAGLTVNGLAP